MLKYNQKVPLTNFSLHYARSHPRHWRGQRTASESLLMSLSKSICYDRKLNNETSFSTVITINSRFVYLLLLFVVNPGDRERESKWHVSTKVEISFFVSCYCFVFFYKTYHEIWIKLLNNFINTNRVCGLSNAPQFKYTLAITLA